MKTCWKLLPLHKIARLKPRASAVPELMFSTSRCFTFFSTGVKNKQNAHVSQLFLVLKFLQNRKSYIHKTKVCSYQYPGTFPALGQLEACCSELLLPPEKDSISNLHKSASSFLIKP